MFWGIVSSVISVLNTFVYQRAVASGVSMGATPLFRSFFNNVVVVPIVLASYVALLPFASSAPFAALDFAPYFSESAVLALAAVAAVANVGASVAGQYAYSNERSGVLAPYSETGRLFTIVAGFFLFSWSSPVTFASAVVAIFAIVGFSVDFRSFSMNRYCAILAASGILRAVSALSIGYVALRASAFTITLFDVSFASALCFGLLAWKKGFPKFQKETFANLTMWTAANDGIWFVSFVISLLLLKNIGIVATSLLWMLTLVLTIAFDSFRLRRLPEPKISALALVVASSVVAGSLFR